MFRSDLWTAAFVRRHNDLGHMCVVARRGDPIAGQIFIEIDHRNFGVVRNVELAACRVGREIVPEAVSGNRNGLDYPIVVRSERQRGCQQAD